MKYLVTIFLTGVFLVIAGLMYIYSEVRFDAYKIIDYHPELSTQIYDRNGELIANIFDKEHRLYTKYDEIPARIIEALVAIEDTSFFEHKGVNFEAIFRALIKDIKAMKMVEGASTLTQQLVKNALLTREKKIVRKLKEVVLAFKIETELSKEEILERYFNEVYFGHGYYGIKTASLGYFHKNLDALNLKEIAILVGLPKAPSSYDPTRNIDLSLSRANRVLYRMHSLGWISSKEYRNAITEQPIVYDETLTKNRAPYVVDEVIKQASREYEDFKTGGYEIHLGIDLRLQQIARESLLVGYNKIFERHKDSNATILNGALISLDSKTGEILAMVGGIDYKKSHFNRAVQSKRQPGSAFKPFLYQKALDVGYSTMSEIPDISRVYTDKKNDKDWKPKNYEENFEGLLTLKEALIHSRNLATINLVNALGMDSVYKELKKDGFKDIPYDLSMALGTFGISPLELSGFYAMFPNYGYKVEPILIKRVINRYGDETIYESEKKRITQSEQAFLIVDILRTTVERGTGRSAKVAGIEVAGKTGTTNSNVDAWFCGFTPEIEVLTWYGNDDNSPMKRYETGGRVAGPAFANFVKEYIKINPQTKRTFTPPDGVSMKKIDGKREYFTKTSPLPKVNKYKENESGGMIF
ncbi:penicillin-binding protein 1A [Sulfurospirillum arcachonense]|uniref:penicillin-binding protein 1A n=1 Tax=Sulfurospirillum arcachonense TaxID=57666 RepID=UPI000469A0C9|nr:PBP1A family penicillin-binding protein [Sulfurospirillum arcachonense]